MKGPRKAPVDQDSPTHGAAWTSMVTPYRPRRGVVRPISRGFRGGECHPGPTDDDYFTGSECDEDKSNKHLRVRRNELQCPAGGCDGVGTFELPLRIESDQPIAT